MSTFSPHSPFVPAPRNANDFPGLKAPEPPNFDTCRSTHRRGWQATRRSVQALRPDQLGLQKAGPDGRGGRRHDRADRADGRGRPRPGNTYLVFSSDNGLHIGEYRLMPGKMTAFDTDIHVPLIVDGPGVLAGSSTDAMAENIDLAKTFAAIGGTSCRPTATACWRSCTASRRSTGATRSWSSIRGPTCIARDPDFQSPHSGNPPSYEAMRTHDFLYVEYKDGGREYYELRTDPFELDNLAPYLSARYARRRSTASYWRWSTATTAKRAGPRCTSTARRPICTAASGDPRRAAAPASGTRQPPCGRDRAARAGPRPDR